MNQAAEYPTPGPVELEEAKDIATVNYALMLLGVIFTPAAFVAMVLVYLKRSKVKGHWLYQHYAWQLKTLWTALFVSLVVLLLFFLVFTFAIASENALAAVPAVLGALIIFGLAVWYFYRSVLGLYRLRKDRPPS